MPRFPLQQLCVGQHYTGCLLRLGAVVQKQGHFWATEASWAAVGAPCWGLLSLLLLHTNECCTARYKTNSSRRWKSKQLSLGHGQCGHCTTMLPTAISLCSISPALIALSLSLRSVVGIYFAWLTLVNCTAGNQQLIPAETDLICIRVRKRRIRPRWGKHWLYQLYRASCKLYITVWGKHIFP